MARVDTDTNEPLCVTKAASAEQDLIGVNCNNSAVFERQCALEFVQILIGSLTVDHSTTKIVENIILGFSKLQYAFVCLLVLQVGLAVQVLGLHVGQAFGQRTRQ